MQTAAEAAKKKKEKRKTEVDAFGSRTTFEGKLKTQSFNLQPARFGLFVLDRSWSSSCHSAEEMPSTGVLPEAELKKSVKTPTGVSTHQRRAEARGPPTLSLEEQVEIHGNMLGAGMESQIPLHEYKFHKEIRILTAVFMPVETGPQLKLNRRPKNEGTEDKK